MSISNDPTPDLPSIDPFPQDYESIGDGLGSVVRPLKPRRMLHAVRIVTIGPWVYELEVFLCPTNRRVLSHRLRLHRLQ